MVIDIHTHIFPDELAPKAKETLTRNINYAFLPYTDLTKKGLLEVMDIWGVDISVIQTIITKPSQLEKTNLWAHSVACDRVIPFGGIFPHSPTYKQDIDFVASLGLKGIKFHAEYQDFYVDSPQMLKIYDYAFSKGLIIMQHAGEDIGMPGPYKSNPQRFARVVDQMQGGVMILGHLGGHRQWDQVYEHLMGKNIYLDTSMGFSYYSPEIFLKIVNAHDKDKILFGSDSPWSNGLEEIKKLKELIKDKERQDLILYKNGAKILNLK